MKQKNFVDNIMSYYIYNFMYLCVWKREKESERESQGAERKNCSVKEKWKEVFFVINHESVCKIEAMPC